MPLRRATLAPIRPRPTIVPPQHTAVPAGSAPAAPAAPATPPDYLALIKASPGYQSWLNSRNQRTSNLATNRATAIRALALQYGGLPSGFKDAYGDLRPEDLDAAAHNQFSVEQGIQRNYEQGVNNMRRSLAARGVLQSGDLGFGQGQADLARGQAEHDSGAQFLDALNQAISGYAGGIGDIAAEEPGIIDQLLPLFQQLYPMPAPAAPAPPPPAAGTPIGRVLPPVPRPRQPVYTATRTSGLRP